MDIQFSIKNQKDQENSEIQICCKIQGNKDNFTETNKQLNIDESWWKETFQRIVTYYRDKFKINQDSKIADRFNLNFLKAKKTVGILTIQGRRDTMVQSRCL